MARWAPGIELSFCEIVVADWPGTTRWYTSVLGLSVIVEDIANGFVLLGKGGIQLALKRGERPAGQAPLLRLVFRVGDVDLEEARLLPLGIEVKPGLDKLHEGYRSIELHDPEGTAITLFSWINRAKAWDWRMH